MPVDEVDESQIHEAAVSADFQQVFAVADAMKSKINSSHPGLSATFDLLHTHLVAVRDDSTAAMAELRGQLVDARVAKEEAMVRHAV